MALKGNLRDFSITQLLNLINLSKKTGTLFVESPSEKISLAFSEGKLAYAHVGNDESNLPSILLSANRITTLQYQVLRERTSQMTDKEIGLLLINAGYGTQDDILNSLQNFYVDIVRRLFTWIEGEFRFETEAFPTDDKITVRLELENLIIEGSRQLREWEQLQEEIPNLDLALQFSEKPGKSIRNVNLSMEEWRVVSFVNPKNTIRQIGKAAHLNELEIRRVVFGLLQAGMVEIVRVGAGPVLRDRMFPTKDRQEQRSLVNRIISRIRSM